MLHMKWLALHHCLWEWSSGEALSSLGQPLWFVLMFWFHNPNILRAVICSLFPFYSVILLLFFSRAKLSTERRGSFKWETEKGWRRRRETGRRELDGEKEQKVTTHLESTIKPWTSPVGCSCICYISLYRNHGCMGTHALTHADVDVQKEKVGFIKGLKMTESFFSCFLIHSTITNHSNSKVYLCTDSLRSEEATREAASTMWLAYCNSSLLLASAGATEITFISESVPL